MSEKFEATTPRGCERGEELVAYLYGEATKEETALFRRHLDACAVCREELAAFGGVREAVGAWRAEALGTVPSLNIEEALAPAARTLSSAPRSRSARAALREFFSLSPLWLRAGACAAALAVCALLALTLARAEVRWGSDGIAFRAGASEKVVRERVEVPVPGDYTDEQVNALVLKKVTEAKAEAAAETEARLKKQAEENVVNVADKKPDDASTQRRKRPARANTRRDETLLAEDDLPRLSDLLSGSY
ncbi:MAG: zf-HC2 domain-containing protein [Acidobacteria bacterium]|nr:zf-HC2 domain-containing protein [Acidobacteriota bacterium]